MAVEFLCLGNDGVNGRQFGAVIHMQECGETETCKWGTRECAPNFFITRVDGIGIKEARRIIGYYGGHRSERILNFSRLPSRVKNNLTKRTVHRIPKAAFVALLDANANVFKEPNELKKLRPR